VNQIPRYLLDDNPGEKNPKVKGATGRDQRLPVGDVAALKERVGGAGSEYGRGRK
jgi:hypothetical protein